MKRILLIAAAFALPGCATLGVPTTENVSVVGDQVVLRSGQALIIAHNGYQSAAAIAELAVKSGQLSNEQLLKLRELNNEALRRLEQAQAGRDVAANAAGIMELTVQILAIARR